MPPDYPVSEAIDTPGDSFAFRMGSGPDPRDNHAPSPERLAGLLAAAARGEDAAWKVIIDLYARRVYALAQTRLRRPDLAEEITQSVFATVAAKLREVYTEQGRFESWLFRIVMNRVRDELRRQRRQAEVRDPGTFRDLAEAEGQEGGGADSESLGALRAAMARLPEADREIVELRHHGGLSFKQLVDVLDEPMGTLLARHHRALKKLKQLIEEARATEGEPEIGAPGTGATARKRTSA